MCSLCVKLAANKPVCWPWKIVCLQVPDEILHHDALNAAIAVLPANYSFEVC